MVCGFLVWCVLLAGQAPNSGRLQPGTILVSSEKLKDPNFVESVVLVTRREKDGGIMGVILNRPMDVTVAKAFSHLKGTTDPVYDGGPVSPEAVQGLLRSTEKPEGAELVMGDIYTVVRKAPLEKSISERLASTKFRVYLGYAGWGPGQLENEVRLGAWTVVHGQQYVFDRQPETLWQRLNKETHSELASVE